MCSPEGAKAAVSHTGSLAGSYMNYGAIFSQIGIQWVEGIKELFSYVVAIAWQPVLKDNRIAIVINTGGPGSYGNGCRNSPQSDNDCFF
ncbi:MAG: hypothetical protein SVY10_00405 [Thermodesulfobacteriota bacterium]|nr:hypothetical protein [Thermodesulfobacteriota bacterium]